MTKKLLTVATTLGLAIATNAYAAKPPQSPPPPPPPPLPSCANTDVQFLSTFATSCVGFLDKNTIQGAVDQEDINALAALNPALTGLTDGQAFLTKLDLLNGATDLTFSGYTFYGQTYFGLHVGGGGTYPGVNSSAYYVVDYGTTGGNTLKLNVNASSNIAVYSTGAPPISPPPPPPPPGGGGGGGPVPEPATWAMMIAGFGGIGALMRRRRMGQVAI